MKANRYKKIRAALCWDLPSAKLSRMHNDANVLCLGARLIPFGLALEIAKIWLETPFEGGRHQRRVDKLDV
jgi:ribose 5-phosphate isomerase B